MTTVSKTEQQTVKTRKRRLIKNALVNVENVTISPGSEYFNWILLTKTKLQQRETELMKIRLQIIQNTIISGIQQFTSENSAAFNIQNHPQVHINVNGMEEENYEAYYSAIHKTNYAIVNTFNEAMTEQLAEWNGYKPKDKNIKDSIETFRDYFKRSRGWWDIRKVNIITTQVIIPISDMIYEFAQQAARKFFSDRFFRLQKLYKTFLYTLILVKLVNKTMKIPNTRELLVFPAQSYSMVEMKRFEELKMQNGCFVMKRLAPAAVKVRNMKSKDIRNDIVKALTEQYNISKFKFQSELFTLHYEVDVMMHNNENNKCTSYSNHHSINYQSKVVRYNPFQM